jgi:hypothetical protein
MGAYASDLPKPRILSVLPYTQHFFPLFFHFAGRAPHAMATE